jgi:hypothetical protein
VRAREGTAVAKGEGTAVPCGRKCKRRKEVPCP